MAKNELALSPQNYTPDKLRRDARKLNSPVLCKFSDYPELGVLRKKDEAGVLMLIRMYLARLNELTAFQRGLNTAQIEYIAEEIMHDGPHLKPPDLNLFFEMVLKGEYGELYNQLDPTKILVFFEKYLAKREQDVADHNDNESSQIKAHESHDRPVRSGNAKTFGEIWEKKRNQENRYKPKS